VALTQISRCNRLEEERVGIAGRRREFPAYAVENQRDRVARRIYAAALIEFPVAIILLYTGRLAAQG